ncbi:MAG TPA: hypothetical protein VFQ53_13375 [Kofleriaceae bacterium]|nr:hypothetical protein [Kofleriaceae bacterium]
MVIGWVMIFFFNHMRFTPPAVFMALGYLGGVAAVYNLFRTGAAAVSPDDPDEASGDAWGLVQGERAELEREKRTLLKAIKEAEFDREMGKLSARDAEHMIRNYRARAIAVIKMLEDASSQPATVREQIEREVKARLAFDAVAAKGASKAAKRKQSKKAAQAAINAARAAAAAGMSGEAAAKIAAEAAAQADADGDKPDGDGKPAEAAASEAAEAAPEARELRDDQEKEATP